jgi:hypothetical protein
VNCGPRSNSFYTVIAVYLLLVLFTFLQTITFYHSIRLILCSQQTGEIDNLTVSWDKVLGCVVCRFHVTAGAKLHPGQVFWRHCRGSKKLPRQLRASKTSTSHLAPLSGAVAKLADINLRKFGSFSYWFDKPWFHN